MGNIYSRKKSSKQVSVASKQSRKETTKQYVPYSPMEDANVDRFQVFHHVMRTIWDGNFCSPIDELLKKGVLVLDLGCGPGTWTCDMAADYKKSNFVGVDILPVFPSEKPFNVQFTLSDVTVALPFQDSTFDFVYIRQMAMWITEHQYTNIVIPELIRVLKPNGWIEICEAELVAEKAGLKLQGWVKKTHDILIRNERNPILATKLGFVLSQMGNMSNVEHKVRMCPMGGWDARLSEVGKMIAIPHLLNILATASVIPQKNIPMITETLIQEATLCHTYYNQHTFFAQKL